MVDTDEQFKSGYSYEALYVIHCPEATQTCSKANVLV
jgi:hypothetical protein